MRGVQKLESEVGCRGVQILKMRYRIALGFETAKNGSNPDPIWVKKNSYAYALLLPAAPLRPHDPAPILEDLCWHRPHPCLRPYTLRKCIFGGKNEMLTCHPGMQITRKNMCSFLARRLTLSSCDHFTNDVFTQSFKTY